MDYNNNIKASLIKVETLQKEYDVILNKYKEASKNYINALKKQETNPNTDNPNQNVTYKALKGRSWWGKSGITEGVVANQKECQALCASDRKCSGATFNPVKRYCWTRKGDGDIVVGDDNNYALIPKNKALLIIMKNLNQQLLDLNQQIINEMINIKPDVIEQRKERNKKHKQLNSTYQHLLVQQTELEKQIQEYNSIEEENDNQSLYTSQQTVSMRFWVLITCLILFITLLKMYGGENPSIAITFWLLIIIVLIVLTYTLRSPSGFFMWFIIIVILVLNKMRNQDNA
jgi:hypothetical protein